MCHPLCTWWQRLPSTLATVRLSPQFLSSDHRKPSLEGTSKRSEFLLLLCLHGWLLLYLLNCLCLNNQWVFSVLLFRFSLPHHWRRVNSSCVVLTCETTTGMFTPAESCTRKARQAQINTALSVYKVLFNHHLCTVICTSYLERSVWKEKVLLLPGYFCQGLVENKGFFHSQVRKT